MSTYSELLKDPLWQKMRLKIMERDNFSCTCCGSTVITLNVHHKEYKPSLKPWEYSMELLTTLCEICHEKEHDIINKIILPERKIISNTWYDLAIHNLYIMERLKFRFLKYKLKAKNKMFVMLIEEANLIQTELFNTPKYV